MMKKIAAEGCTLELDKGNGVVSITTPASMTVKGDGKGLYRGQLAISISGYTGGSITVAGSGTGAGVINGSAEKTTIDGLAAVLEGDNVTVTVAGLKPLESGGTEPTTENVKVTIKDAGQGKVLGE